MHHNPQCNNFKYHVLRIGRINYCNGCFANRIFLALLLPIYLLFLVENLDPIIVIAIVVYSLFQIGLSYTMAITGRQFLQIFSGVCTTIYLLLAHFLLLSKSINFDISGTTLIALIIVFSLPQFAMYLWKITTSQDFKFPKIKLLIRLSFVHGYLSAILLTRHDFYIGLATILATSVLFLLTRQISSWKINNGESTNTEWRKTSVRKQFTIIKNSFVIGPQSSRTLLPDTSAEQEIQSCCECCCACVCCCLCCGQCGELDGSEPYV
jgi:hypothetical protein